MIYTPSNSFTRPADTTQYGANDLVANSTTAASVTPLKWGINGSGRTGRIRGVRLYKSDKTVTLASFKVYIFGADPGVPTNGDNGALAIASAANFLDVVTIDLATGAFAGGTTGVMKRTGSLDIPFNFPDLTGKLYGLIQATAAYTPASGETFTATLEIEVA